MRKVGVVVLISVISVTVFGTLIFYGLTHSRGIPTTVTKPQRIVLEVPFIDTGIDLANAPASLVWDSLSAKDVKLMYQLMVRPWPKAVVPLISVKAFHNKTDIYFYITWKDDTEDRLHETNKFSDACAIMFPLSKEPQPATIMMGFIGTANIWYWKASRDKEYWGNEGPLNTAYADFHYPFEEKEMFPVSKEVPKSAVSDLVAIRAGTITPKDTQNVEGRGFWQDGKWRVVFKRSLKALDPEQDAVFSATKIGGSAINSLESGVGGNLGQTRLCGFAVWNGAKGDRGGRKSISEWVELVIK